LLPSVHFLLTFDFNGEIFHTGSFLLFATAVCFFEPAFQFCAVCLLGLFSNFLVVFCTRQCDSGHIFLALR
jgi:hypothetical protein